MNDRPPIAAVFDGGHSDVKFSVAGVTQIEFPHLLATIDEDEYQRLASQSGRRRLPEVLKVSLTGRDDDTTVEGFYAVGLQAREYRHKTRRRELRYQPDYIGILFAGALAHAFEKQPTQHKLRLTALYPVGDNAGAVDLAWSLKGVWNVQCANGPALKFSVKPSPFPEGFSGLMAAALDKDGNEHPGWKNDSILAIDIGGNTVNVVAFERGWRMEKYDSFELGVNQAIDGFARLLHKEYPELVPAVSSYNLLALREAIREGKWTRRGEYDLHDLTKRIKVQLMNRLTTDLDNYNLSTYNRIVLVGGGAGLLWDHLLETILNMDVTEYRTRDNALVAAAEQGVFFASSVDTIQYANVMGARRAQLGDQV